MSAVLTDTFDANKGRTEIVVGGMQTVYEERLEIAPETVVTLKIHDSANHVEWVLGLTKDDAVELSAAILREANAI